MDSKNDHDEKKVQDDPKEHNTITFSQNKRQIEEYVSNTTTVTCLFDQKLFIVTPIGKIWAGLTNKTINKLEGSANS